MNFNDLKFRLYCQNKLQRFAILVILFSFCYQAAEAQKKPLDHSVYDAWQSLGIKMWTTDGTAALYQLVPQEGDKILYLKKTNSSQQVTLPRGENPMFTFDSKYAVALIKPFYKDIREGKIKKKKEEDLPKDSLAIVHLSNLQIEKIPLVKSYKIPEKGGAVLAYLRHKNTEIKRADSTATDSVKTKKVPIAEPSKKKDKVVEPLQLVLVDLARGKQLTIENVVEYEFSKNGKRLVFATSEPQSLKAKKSDTDSVQTIDQLDKPVYGVYLFDTDRFVRTLVLEGQGEFSQFVFDETAERLAFIGTLDDKKKEVKTYRLYSSFKNKTAEILSDYSTKGMPENWVVSENRKPIFSRNGKRVFFGIAPQKTAKDTTLIMEDHAVLDVWNYKDDYLQTVQLKNLDKELKRSYLAAIQFDKPTVLRPLSDANLPEVAIVDEGNADYVLGYSDLKGRKATQWNGFAARDYFTVSLRDGHSKEVITGLNGYATSSPLGKYVVYFNRETGNWYSYQYQSQKHTVLNSGLKQDFAEEEFDMPDAPNAYGIVEWTVNDQSVLIRDRYDIWEFFLDGSKPPHCITHEFGRKNKIRFNYHKLDSDIRSISLREPLLLTAFDEVTKKAGFYRTNLRVKHDPEMLMMEPMFSNNAVVKAKNAEVYMYNRESFTQSPSLFTTVNFKESTVLIETNAQQQKYNWGTASLITWTTDKGKPASGILYKPEDFDASKKYPMIVYFYEKLTDNLNRYEAPAPTPSRLNITYFVSNGYLVFTPDISYEKGYPGRSAEEYINSGVDFLKENTWVDGTKIGIQGQSWGGYQVAHLITRSNRYAAAWSGAPVVNMTSAYGGIRWASGMNRQFQYEKTQSRIGATLWEAQDLYIENSPLFFMDRVETPVAIMHNDNDGAVPWYQGIEMFTALRRLGKPVWMLNYNGDEHNLMQRQNRKDIQIREQQFFDHYLKGTPIPVWMDTGIPAVLKGKTWGFDLVK